MYIYFQHSLNHEERNTLFKASALTGQRGIALLELAILLPIVTILAFFMLILGQLYLSASKVNSIIDTSLQSFVLTESEGSWTEELNLLAAGLSGRLLEVSANEPPTVLIAMAKTNDDRTSVINGISTTIDRSSTQSPNQPELQSLNNSLISIVSSLQTQASSNQFTDLTGLSLTKVVLPTRKMPLDFDLGFMWPTIHQRLTFINQRQQF